jgi:hypothetical protein
MEYFNTALGGFAPHRDKDGAIKFALNAILMDNRVQELSELVIDGNPLGGIEGEPGWILERRDVADDNEIAHLNWPKGARFMASVDEQVFRLQYSQCFMSRDTFIKYLMSAIDAYVSADPSRATVPAVIALRKAIA